MDIIPASLPLFDLIKLIRLQLNWEHPPQPQCSVSCFVGFVSGTEWGAYMGKYVHKISCSSIGYNDIPTQSVTKNTAICGMDGWAGWLFLGGVMYRAKKIKRQVETLLVLTEKKDDDAEGHGQRSVASKSPLRVTPATTNLLLMAAQQDNDGYVVSKWIQMNKKFLNIN